METLTKLFGGLLVFVSLFRPHRHPRLSEQWIAAARAGGPVIDKTILSQRTDR